MTRWPDLAALAACAALAIAAPARGDDDEDAAAAEAADQVMPLKSLRLPLEYYDSGRIRTQLFAGEASVPPKGRIRARDVRIEFYRDDGALEGVVTTRECDYNRPLPKIRSRAPVRYETRDALVTGGRMKWDMDDRRVTVSSNACLVAARDAWALGGALAAERDAALWMPGLAPERFGTNRTVITGQEMRYDVGAGVVRFSGAVRARDTEFSLEADDVLVMLRPDRTVKSALAVGNVRFLRGDSAASCRKALYLDGTREVVLLGGATVTRGQESVAGGMITYWLDEERAACEDGRMVMYPRGRDGAGASAGGPGFPLLSGWRKKSDG